MPPTNVRARLVEAMAGRSVETLRAASGIACSRVSLHRKLHGYSRRHKQRGRWVKTWSYQALTVEEMQQLARALDLRLDLGAP